MNCVREGRRSGVVRRGGGGAAPGLAGVYKCLCMDAFLVDGSAYAASVVCIGLCFFCTRAAEGSYLPGTAAVGGSRVPPMPVLAERPRPPVPQPE
ncbi:hypothetical protein ABZP36_031217 [Zizania latifolia]